MLSTMRALVVIAIVCSSSAAAAQIVDPFEQSDAPKQPEPPPEPKPEPPPPPPSPPPPSPPPASPTTLTMRRSGDWIDHHAPIMRPRRVREAPPPQRAVEPDAVEPEAPPRRYPYEITLRPLVLPPGVTEVGLAYQLRSAVTTHYDEHGQLVTERVSKGRPDLHVAHTFSRAEVGVGGGASLYGWVGIDTRAFPERVGVSAAFTTLEPDDSYLYSQSLSARHRLWREQNVSLVGGAAVHVYELGVRGPYGFDAGYVSGSGDLTFQVQFSTHFAFWVGVAAAAPVWESELLDVREVAGGSSGVVIAADTWDIVASGSMAMDAVQPGEPVTQVLLGLRKRFGL